MKTYEIYREDKTTLVSADGSGDYPFLTWTDSDHAQTTDPTDIVISVQTTDPVYYTNADVTYYIKATLDNYVILYPDEATIWVPFLVNIQNC